MRTHLRLELKVLLTQCTSRMRQWNRFLVLNEQSSQSLVLTCKFGPRDHKIVKQGRMKQKKKKHFYTKHWLANKLWINKINSNYVQVKQLMVLMNLNGAENEKRIFRPSPFSRQGAVFHCRSIVSACRSHTHLNPHLHIPEICWCQSRDILPIWWVTCTPPHDPSISETLVFGFYDQLHTFPTKAQCPLIPPTAAAGCLHVPSCCHLKAWTEHWEKRDAWDRKKKKSSLNHLEAFSTRATDI